MLTDAIFSLLRKIEKSSHSLEEGVHIYTKCILKTLLKPSHLKPLLGIVVLIHAIAILNGLLDILIHHYQVDY